MPYRENIFENDDSPLVGVRLLNPHDESKAIDTIAIMDSGASYSLFNGIFCQDLGINLTLGRPKNFIGLAGSLKGYIHQVIIEIEGEQFKCDVAFSEQNISRNLVGRFSLFEKIRIGIQGRHRLLFFHPAP